MGLIIFEREVLKPESEDIRHRRIELHHRKRIRLTRQLQLCLLEVIVVEVHIPESMNEVPGLEIADLGDHQGEEGIGRDIERNAKKDVGTALVKLTAQPLLSIGTGRDIELEKCMTGHQRHLGKIGDIPGTDDQPAAVGILFYLVDQLTDLIDRLAVGAFPTAPLFAINRAQLTIGVGPFIPDADPIFLQEFNVRIPPEEPKQLIYNALQMDLLGCHQRKTLAEIEAQLIAKIAGRPGAGTVGFDSPGIDDMLKKIEVLLHGCNLRILEGNKPPHLKPLINTLRCLKIAGRFFFISNLKIPRRFRLIAYQAVIPMKGKTTLIHRICGIAGDVVEIRRGTLFVNGKEADGELRLKHIYKVSQQYAGSFEYKEEEAYTIPPYSDTVYIPLEDHIVKKEQVPCTRYVLPAGLRDEAIFRVYQQSWNLDNFGPLRVPPGKFFVLGDNRGKSQDSRYLGLIDQPKVIGTVLWR
jgi:signal peptidase I